MYKALLFLISILSLLSCDKKLDYSNLPVISNRGYIQAVIEIPAGTNKKIEYNYNNERFEPDMVKNKERVISFLPYLGNYGFIPSTLLDTQSGGDGDALDVLVLASSVPTGTVIEIVPVGVLKLIDAGEVDSKIIAIPANTNDQIIAINSYQDLNLKYPEVKKIIELWFLNYNKEDKTVLDSWGDEKEALIEIERSKVE